MDVKTLRTALLAYVVFVLVTATIMIWRVVSGLSLSALWIALLAALAALGVFLVLALRRAQQESRLAPG